MQRFICSMVLAGICAGASLSAPLIIENGAPRAQIIIADKPPRAVRLAAKELQAGLQRISGATVPILSAPGASGAVRIHVGRSAETDRLGISDADLADGAFRMVSGDGWLVLLGRDSDYVPNEPVVMSRAQRAEANAFWQKVTGQPWWHFEQGAFKRYNRELDIWTHDEAGSLYAVYQFLRDLGMRWYMPGEIGEVRPSLKSIPLPKVDKTVRPAFGLRHLFFAEFGAASAEDVLWFWRLGLSFPSGLRFGHSLLNIHGPEEVKKTRPEFYMIINGKRDTTGCKGFGRPCLSEPLLEATLAYVRAFFDTYPHETMFPVMPPDAYSTMCQGECCQGKGTPERGRDGHMSDYVWGFVNRVAIEIDKTHPGKLIGCCAYGAYRQPPARIEKMHPNVVVVHCQHRSDDYDPEARKARIGIREA